MHRALGAIQHTPRTVKLIQNIGITFTVLLACTGAALLLSRFDNDNNPFAACLYILCVALISRFTAGYACGVAASVIGVACVNYLFTYPFYQFNLSLTGYPLTFAVMLMVSVIVSATSTRLKQQERIRFEARNEQMRANLLRSVSHDLRTPLASILGASSALLENRALTQNERDELVQEIQKDAQWLTRVTENLLSVTKLNGDSMALAKTEEVVEEIVGSAIVKFRRRKDALPISVEAPDDIVLLEMDATLIEQVLINLFENVEAHGRTATRIKLLITLENARVVFCVADDGAGFSAAVIPHLFDGQLSASVQTDSDGRRNMGIGLSVCRSIIMAHGGGMSARNNETGGAAIMFWLPRAEKGGAV